MAFRKSWVAGVLALSGVAFAQNAPQAPPSTDVPTQQKPEQAQPPSAQPQQPGATAQPQKPEGPDPIQQIFKEKKEAFSLQGKILGFDPQVGAIVLEREKQNLPPAMLLLAEETQVTVNGKKATLQDLLPGADVRAQFQLAQGYPVALQLDAKGGQKPKEPAGAAPAPAPEQQPKPKK